MLILNKWFSPEAHDICPNCGEACAITDVLCPKCGKNLDELFEQLPDPEVIYVPNWIAKILANPQVIKGWNIANSIILAVSLLTPWIIFFSDVIVIKIQLQYVIGFQILLSPIFALISHKIFPLAEFLSIFGLSLLEAVAPAIALYYSVYGIRTVRKMKTDINTPTLRYSHAILRLLFALISLALIRYGVGFNSYMSFGYILVIIGLSSTFFLELIVPVLGNEQTKRKAT